MMRVYRGEERVWGGQWLIANAKLISARGGRHTPLVPVTSMIFIKIQLDMPLTTDIIPGMKWA